MQQDKHILCLVILGGKNIVHLDIFTDFAALWVDILLGQDMFTYHDNLISPLNP